METTLFSKEILDKINEIVGPLCLSQQQYIQVRDSINVAMSLGLSPKTNSSASIKMFPSYVTSLPKNEIGKFVALDLGGTNFRVLLIDLDGTADAKMLSQVFEIPYSVRYGTADILFDHIVACMDDFFTGHDIDVSKETNQLPIPLGFTFSFPCKQSGLNHAVLMRWTKDFNCEGVVGQNVVELLHRSIAKKDMNVQCFAVVNDTVGTLLSCALENSNTAIGLIIGTGTNACYSENVEKIETLDEKTIKNNNMMIINTEWGAFGGNGELDLVLSEFDKIIDSKSINKGQQIFEKMISGFYMGELVRLVLLQLNDAGCLSSECSGLSSTMEERQCFLTKYVSEIVNDPDENMPTTRAILSEFGVTNPIDADMKLVKYVSTVVSERAARLVACGLGVLIDRVDSEYVVIGIDGSLYRYHDYFSKTMEIQISNLTTKKFKTCLSLDGSGKGAAVAASVAFKEWSNLS